MTHTYNILKLIQLERERQEKLKQTGKFQFTCADQVLDCEKLPILLEEVGEVAKAMNEMDSLGIVRELIQVAAVSVAWLESSTNEKILKLLYTEITKNRKEKE
ncbi:hypothetical protein [Leptospira noguchii]|uniref:NTP pyrophosphohydrolase MazG putative catalytic core domain-containing protein n=1 Tax=Leptospira noguchii str. 2001034031 TaxID=1193053 RepID=M6YNR4_9LEPT|nr:hypothetical protein [Leptospira noguchii]EMO91249.1 hypothetical protein LEP1GSC024_3082 [Leptospira noguchii str. 2001034031]